MGRNFSNLKVLLRRDAKRIAEQLRPIPGLKIKSKCELHKSNTGGFFVTLASWRNGITVELYLDHMAGLDRARFWVGFYAKLPAKLEAILSKHEPIVRLTSNDFEPDEDGEFRYKRPRKGALTRDYAEFWDDGSSYYGYYDWGGHHTESLKAARWFIERTVSAALDGRSTLDDAIDDLGTDHPSLEEFKGKRYARNPKVREAVKRRAGGKCEYCGEPGFECEDGHRYLECHHILGLADEGSDRMTNVIAVCSRDHREAHFGKRRAEIEIEMIERVRAAETSRLNP